MSNTPDIINVVNSQPIQSLTPNVADNIISTNSSTSILSKFKFKPIYIVIIAIIVLGIYLYFRSRKIISKKQIKQQYHPIPYQQVFPQYVPEETIDPEIIKQIYEWKPEIKSLPPMEQRKQVLSILNQLDKIKPDVEQHIEQQTGQQSVEIPKDDQKDDFVDIDFSKELPADV